VGRSVPLIHPILSLPQTITGTERTLNELARTKTRTQLAAEAAPPRRSQQVVGRD
jgi:hypothetical protein